MFTALLIACAVATLASLMFLFLYLLSRSKCKQLDAALKRFDEIADLEKFAQDQRAMAQSAKDETNRTNLAREQLTEAIKAHEATIAAQSGVLANQQQQFTAAANTLGAYKDLDELKRQVEKQKQQVAQYNQVLGNFKSADELRTHIAQQTARVQELNRTVAKFENVTQLDRHIAGQQSQIAALQLQIKGFGEALAGASTATELQARIKYQENLLAELQMQAQQVEEALHMQEFGFYRPRYDFDSSSKYQTMLERVRAEQTKMVKGERAVVWEKNWVVEGSDVKGRKMMSEQTKLMLRAFNGECDAAVAKVKYNNANNLETRINRSCEQINKLTKTNAASITHDYLQLKLQELYLVHEHRVKQQEEKEEQQRIKEQMREEEKARREIEQAEEEAAKEEAVAERALDKARRAFEVATKGQILVTEETKAQNALLAAQVAKLENELKDAIDRKAKAIARAQLTKSGHVYVLSNIGSFGEDMYKLGLTRRLEPLERVKELGDASVPFEFDVHAMIYSEDAPALERKLHEHFSHRRVNLVNLRREYFHVTLDEVIDAVKQYFGEITFVTVPEAAEYRQTLAKRKADQGAQSSVVDELARRFDLNQSTTGRAAAVGA